MGVQLQDFATDLTGQARAGRLDPVLGRESEIERLIRILTRKTKNNPVLLGEPGVGKTAIVEGLALRLAADAIPPALAGVRVLSLDLGQVLAGTRCRGDFEERWQGLVAKLREARGRSVLFIDEIHLIARAGRSEGGLDAGNLLKPLLARGELPCIGASTPQEWAELIAGDPALERRFQTIAVQEPTNAETLAMLRGLRSRYEQHHRVTILDEALDAAVHDSVAIGPTRKLPDKAIDLLDEACAMLRLLEGGGEDAELARAEGDLLRALHTFDLVAFTRLKHRVLPALRGKHRAVVDRASVLKVIAATSVETLRDP